MFMEKSFPPVYLIVCSGCGCLWKNRFPPDTVLFIMDAGVYGKIVSPRIPYCLFWMRVFMEKSFPPVYLIVCSHEPEMAQSVAAKGRVVTVGGTAIGGSSAGGGGVQ